ncbi:unnamed protein product, partial [Urochloa humidicola]
KYLISLSPLIQPDGLSLLRPSPPTAAGEQHIRRLPVRRAHATEIRCPRRALGPRFADPASPPCPEPTLSRSGISGVKQGLGAARWTGSGPGGSRRWWRRSTGRRCLGACRQSSSGAVQWRGMGGRAGTRSSYGGIVSWLGRPDLAEAVALPRRSGWTQGEDGVGDHGSNTRCGDLGIPCPHTDLTTNLPHPPVIEVKRATAEPLLATRIRSQAYDSAHAFLFFCRVSIYRKVSP